jgi:hypothetical protein
MSGAADRASTPRPIELTPKGTIAGARQPQAALVGVGTVHVTFAAGESIYVTTSTDAGKTFESPHRVADVGQLMAGMRRGPRIAADEKTIVVSAIGGKDGNLMAWRSTDGGRNWQGPETVNSIPRSAREGLHGVAIGPDGQVACVWLDLRSKSTQLCCSISHDGGATWGENHVAYQSPDGSICECCHPGIAWDAKGTLTVMWRNSLGGNRDLYLSTSADDGKTFAEATKLGTGSWRKDSCPMDGGAFAVVSPGRAATVWRREQDVFYTAPGEKKEQRLGPGEQPTIAASGSDVYLAWVTRRQGPLMLKLPKSTKPVELASGANDPVLAAGTDKGPVVLVWETGRGRDTSVWFATLSDRSR